MLVSKIFSFFFVCLLAVCGNSVSQTENTHQIYSKEKIELFLSLKRSGCYGPCPVYDLTIEPDGKIIFEGKFWTDITGKAEDKLSEEQVKQLITEIEKTNFFSLDNAYTYKSNNCPTTATDMETVTIFIRLNGKEKTIEHYWGCWKVDESKKDNSSKEDYSSNIKVEKSFSPNVFPQPLYNLENKIDEIVGTERWIGDWRNK